MELRSIIEHPNSRQHLERYVNDGSPSGFSTLYTTSPRTSPFELHPWFRPFICTADPDKFRQYGEIPNIEGTNGEQWIMIHPDMARILATQAPELNIEESHLVKVMPTSSGRTVQILDHKRQDYFKLHYEGILGRITRELPYRKSVAGPELSTLITKAIDEGKMNPELTLMREVGARNLSFRREEQVIDWGMVYRENVAYGLSESSHPYIIPAFSMFSTDRLASYHYPLLKQIISDHNFDPEKYTLYEIIEPIIRSYFNLLLTLGLQAEWNSQNLLLAFNKDFRNIKVVMRDLESIDKDLTIMKGLGLDTEFESGSYKTIFQGQFNYQIKHSFMYDFKLGESILDPFLYVLVKFFKANIYKLRDSVKEMAEPFLKRLPNDFLPSHTWFMFDKVLVDQRHDERPYLEIANPKFR